MVVVPCQTIYTISIIEIDKILVAWYNFECVSRKRGPVKRQSFQDVLALLERPEMAKGEEAGWWRGKEQCKRRDGRSWKS